MRSFLIRRGVAVVLLATLWFTSRWCALLVDPFYTPRLATLQSYLARLERHLASVRHRHLRYRGAQWGSGRLHRAGARLQGSRCL